MLMLWQFTAISSPGGIDGINAGVSSDALVPFIIGVILLISVIAALFLARALLHHVHEKGFGFDLAILLILVPKEVKEEKEQPQGLEWLRQKIAIAETFFSAIGGLKPQHSLKAWLLGRSDHFSFEIVAQGGRIAFYAAVPRSRQSFFEQQLQAQFPDAHIEEVLDYNIFSKTGAVVGSYITFTRSSYFPIKSYKILESDPLNALTNSLSKVSPEDGAALQLTVRSAHKEWRAQGIHVAKELQKGKKIEDLEGFGAFREFLSSWFSRKKDADAVQIHLTPNDEQMIKGLEEKSGKAGLELNIRVVASSVDATRAKLYLDNIVGAFSQFNQYQVGNSFHGLVPSGLKHFVQDFIYRSFRLSRRIIVNAEEMASLFHPPLPLTETPNIRWLAARKAPPPVNIPQEGLVIGHSIYRGADTVIRIKRPDRRRHLYVIGKSGSGKSVLIENMAVQDIKNGDGVCVIDPHGDLVGGILRQIPPERADDVIVFDPSDTERPVGLNMLEAPSEEARDFAVQEMISIFYKLFPPEMIGPMFEHNMRNVMLTLMSDQENPGTIAEIPRMFSDQDFQQHWVSKVTDPVVRAFWEKEMAKTSDFHKSEMLGYLISKVGRFVENEMMRNIIGQQKSGFDLREVMDKRKILLVNLAKGKTGEVNSELLGLIIVSKLQMAALARADLPEAERHDFFLYIDEFQNFITPSIATILSEARKYRLNLIIAHQYMGQLSPKGDNTIRDAVLGNVGTMAVFRIGVEDAEILAKEFAPVFGAYDLVNVEQYTAYMKVLIDNTASRPFTMLTYPPQKGNKELAEALIELSRLKHGREKMLVESEILERTQLGVAAGAQTDLEKTL